jgi:hypothetical protein
VSGEHDGYRRLADPVVHRRTLHLGGVPSILTVTDEIVAAASHDVAVHLHVAETADVVAVDQRGFEIRVDAGVARLTLDGALRVEVVRASTDPPGGWVSRGYHRRSPSTTLVGRARSRGTLEVVCRVELHPRPRPGSSGP